MWYLLDEGFPAGSEECVKKIKLLLYVNKKFIDIKQSAIQIQTFMSGSDGQYKKTNPDQGFTSPYIPYRRGIGNSEVSILGLIAIGLDVELSVEPSTVKMLMPRISSACYFKNKVSNVYIYPVQLSSHILQAGTQEHRAKLKGKSQIHLWIDLEHNTLHRLNTFLV